MYPSSPVYTPQNASIMLDDRMLGAETLTDLEVNQKG